MMQMISRYNICLLACWKQTSDCRIPKEQLVRYNTQIKRVGHTWSRSWEILANACILPLHPSILHAPAALKDAEVKQAFANIAQDRW